MNLLLYIVCTIIPNIGCTCSFFIWSIHDNCILNLIRYNVDTISPMVGAETNATKLGLFERTVGLMMEPDIPWGGYCGSQTIIVTTSECRMVQSMYLACTILGSCVPSTISQRIRCP
jgi:hypothetical protein